MTRSAATLKTSDCFGRFRIAGAVGLAMVAMSGSAWAQDRLPGWQPGLSLVLALVLTAGLVAVLAVLRQLARATDQLAGVCALIATLDRNTRTAETKGTEALNRAAERLETALTDSETSFRDDATNLRATLRYLETYGESVSDLIRRLETLPPDQPQRPDRAQLDPAWQPSHSVSPDSGPSQPDGAVRVQADQDATFSEMLQALRALGDQLPAQLGASAARLDAALADAVTRRLGLFETVGAAITRLIERADEAVGLARLEAIATRLDGAAAAIAPLNDVLTRLETTAGLPPLLTRLIEQAQDAQSDLIARASAVPQTPQALRTDVVARLDVLSSLPPLLARMTQDAGEANAAFSGLATSALADIQAAASGLATFSQSMSALDALKNLPAQMTALTESVAGSHASFAATVGEASARFSAATATLSPLASSVTRLEALSSLPSELAALAENLTCTQAMCNGAGASAAGAIEKLTVSIGQLERLSGLPAELERLAGSAITAQASVTGAADAASAQFAEAAERFAAGADGSLATLHAHVETLGVAAAGLAETEPALAGLHAALTPVPEQLTTTLAGFSQSLAQNQDHFYAAWTRQHNETATAIETLAARADAALAALPAEADLVAGMLEGASRTEARLSEAASRLETMVATPFATPISLDPVLHRLDAVIAQMASAPQTAETLECLCADLRAVLAGLTAPAWLPRLAELENVIADTLTALRARDVSAEPIERAVAALTAAATETMGQGYAQLHRMDTFLSRAAQPPAELQTLAGLIGDLRAALAAQMDAARDVQRAAGLALAHGETQQNNAERLLAAAEAVRQAATPREGLAVIPSLAATCRALATEFGALARGGTAPPDLAISGPVLLAALQQGADDLRTAATALALAQDALPHAA